MLIRISSGVLFIVIVVQKAHSKRRLASDGPPENTGTLCVPPNLDRFDDDIWTVSDALSFPRASWPYSTIETRPPGRRIRYEVGLEQSCDVTGEMSELDISHKSVCVCVPFPPSPVSSTLRNVGPTRHTDVVLPLWY